MKPTRTRFIVLAGLCSAAALAYFVRNGVALAESTICADLGLTKEQSGMIDDDAVRSVDFGAWFLADPVLAVIIINAVMYCAGAVTPGSFGGPQSGIVNAITNVCGNFGAASFPIVVLRLIAHASG